MLTQSFRQEFQFFPERLSELQEREYNAYRVSSLTINSDRISDAFIQRLHEIPAMIREAPNEDITQEKLEAERDAEQKKIDEGMFFMSS